MLTPLPLSAGVSIFKIRFAYNYNDYIAYYI